MSESMVGQISRRGGLLAMLFCLAACTTLGPDYREPEVEWLSDWQTDLYGQLATPDKQTEVDLRFWWRLFDDPALNSLIDAARQDNVPLRIAGLRILESRAVLGGARSTRYPQVQQVTGGVAYVTSKEQGSGGAEDLAAYQAGFGLGWELDFWGRFQRGIESADAAFFASMTNHQDVQVLLSAQVADLYYAYLSTQLQIGIAHHNADIQKRSFEITERLYNSGQDSELDLQQAKTQYLSTVSTIPDLEITLIQIRNALAALLGRPPGDLPELKSVPAALPSMDPVLIRDIPARFLARRPDIRVAAWQVAAQSAQIGIAQTEFYPAISLLGTIGWTGNSISSSPDVGSLAVGPALTWNVFDYGRIRNNVRVQDARLEQTIGNFEEKLLQAAREIDDAAIGIVKTSERQVVLGESVEAATRSLDLANSRYREGYADFQRVLDAQQAMFRQTESELINQSRHISAIVDLYRAFGGGWVDMPIEELIPESLRDTMEDRSNWGELLTAPLPVNLEKPASGRGASQQ